MEEKNDLACEFCIAPHTDWGKLVNRNGFYIILISSIVLFILFGIIWKMSIGFMAFFLWSNFAAIALAIMSAIILLFPTYAYIFRDKQGKKHCHAIRPATIDGKFFRPRDTTAPGDTLALEIPGVIIKLKIHGLFGGSRLLNSRRAEFPNWEILGINAGYIRLTSNMISAVNNRHQLLVSEISVSPEMALDIIESQGNINNVGWAIQTCQKAEDNFRSANQELNKYVAFAAFLTSRVKELVAKLIQSKAQQDSDIGRYAREELEKTLNVLPSNGDAVMAAGREHGVSSGMLDKMHGHAGVMPPIPVRHKTKKQTTAAA